MAELRLEGIDKRFGAIHAVRALDLEVADGEFVVLLGPTGAGKTTTLRTVAGLERPDAGRVLLGGRDVTAAPPAARDIAFVFQTFSLYPHLNVFDNLAFPLRAPARRRPEAEIRARVHAVAELLRITDKLANRATQLSGGEMQRVAVGRALVREPALFLMDEPLSSLDAKLRETLRIELKRIQRDLGATLLYVTHDQVEAMTLADRIGVIEKGTLLQIGEPRALYGRPDSIAVARRLGSPAINLLPPQALGAIAMPKAAAHVGLRPEDVRIGADAYTATVRQIEPLGAETVLLLTLGEHTVRAATPTAEGLAVGATIGFAPRPGSLLFFDAAGHRLEA